MPKRKYSKGRMAIGLTVPSLALLVALAAIAVMTADRVLAQSDFPPTGLIATAGNEAVCLAWDDGPESVLTYNVYRRAASESLFTQVNTGVTVSEFLDTGLTNGTTYSYEVAAVDAAPDESPRAGPVLATPLNNPWPIAPTGLTATVGDLPVTIAWDACREDGVNYNVYRRTVEELGFSRIATGIAVTEYLDTQVIQDTSYVYQVTAHYSDGVESVRSNPVSAAPLEPTLLAAPAPIVPPVRDFFGTVDSVRENSLLVSTKRGNVEVSVSDETKIQVPRKRDAGITDLVPGDRVAVSLEAEGEPVADRIRLIPGKTRHRHVPGVVVELSGSAITIQPPGANAEPITFDITSAKIRFHRGKSTLELGAFVVIGTARDPDTGQLSLVAREINVTSAKIRRGGSVEPESIDAEEDVEHQNTADIRGALDGVDADGNLIVNGTTIFLDPDTEIEDGLVIGQLLDIEAVIRPDGSVLALEVEEQDGEEQVRGRIRLEGSFDGLDDQGNWIIGGTVVAVDSSSDTDGVPALGQRVKVKALLQEDGSLLAREVENKRASGKPEDTSRKVKLKGTFQGTDTDGNWIINGKRVAVDALTRLKGSPAVGHQIAVEAVLQPNGGLLANKVKSARGGPDQRKREAKIRGVIEDILDDGTLIVGGVPVAVDALTELEDGAQEGDFVEVEALIEEDGALLAREVEREAEAAEEDIPEPSKVEIEGTIESVEQDGPLVLVVNGVTVTTSVLSEIKGRLVLGDSVKVEGVLNSDGSVLAQEVKGEGRRATASGTEVKVKGLIEQVNRDGDGNLVSLVVDGLPVGIGALTRVEGGLEPEIVVSIKGIISDGVFLARQVEAESREREPQEAETEIEGLIENIQLDEAGRIVAFTVNGVEISVETLTELKGLLEEGARVEVDATLRQGILLAVKIEARRNEREKGRPQMFELEGLVEDVDLDEDGNILAFTVDGRSIDADLLTRVRGDLDLGARVKIEGIISEGRSVAAKIRRDGAEAKAEREQNRAEAKARRERERAEAKEDREVDRSGGLSPDDSDDDRGGET